jgi:hypothetical protein
MKARSTGDEDDDGRRDGAERGVAGGASVASAVCRGFGGGSSGARAPLRREVLRGRGAGSDAAWAGAGDAWPAGCGATERRAGGRPSGGGREKREREKKQRTEKKGLDVFKYLIFCSQGVAAENKQIFSTAVSEATENTLIFGGCVSGRRK